MANHLQRLFRATARTPVPGSAARPVDFDVQPETRHEMTSLRVATPVDPLESLSRVSPASQARQIGFLHTADAHVATFGALVEQLAGEQQISARSIHRVRPELLVRAHREGATADLAASVAAELGELAAAGAEVIICTCSTLGPIVEQAGGSGQDRDTHPELLRPVIPPVMPTVIRIDRPVAAAAVRAGERIAVVAALESAVAPIRELLAEEARRAGREVEVVERCVPEAWVAFENGDTATYLAQVAQAAREAAADRVGSGGSVEVVVLAQASMAGAADQLADLGLPVLTSPALAVQAALATNQ